MEIYSKTAHMTFIGKAKYCNLTNLGTPRSCMSLRDKRCNRAACTMLAISYMTYLVTKCNCPRYATLQDYGRHGEIFIPTNITIHPSDQALKSCKLFRTSGCNMVAALHVSRCEVAVQSMTIEGVPRRDMIKRCMTDTAFNWPRQNITPVLLNN